MRPELRDGPLLHSLVEVHVRAVVDGDVEMRADRLLGKHDAGFVLEQRDGLRTGVKAGNRRRICAASSIS